MTDVAPSITILVVEDDDRLLEGLRDILNMEGYACHTAQDGIEALRLLKQMTAPPDLIVSDVMMPRMDGMTLLETVRGDDRWRSVPFIFLTARGDKTDVQRGKRLGVDDYIIKPFDVDDLLVAVSSRLVRQRGLQDAHQHALDDLKRSILRILNHEFRTPLSFVVAYADMLKDYQRLPATPDDAELVTFLRGVQGGADRLHRLINQFILLVELETGAMARNFAYHKRALSADDLCRLLHQAREASLSNAAGQAGALIVSCPDAISGAVVGVPQLLLTAVGHLLDNAVKFSPAGAPVVAQLVQDGAQIGLAVRDRGRGIAVEEHERIWQMFYQVDRQQHEDQGTGNGLAIVQRIATLHRGRATVESALGQGSTFTLWLPQCAATDAH